MEYILLEKALLGEHWEEYKQMQPIIRPFEMLIKISYVQALRRLTQTKHLGNISVSLCRLC